MDGQQIIIFTSIAGFVIVASLIVAGVIIGRRDNRYLTERFSMLQSDSQALLREMSRKTDLAVEFLREQSILNRQILERVDKH